MPEELWTEVHDIVQETGIKTISKKKKCKKAKWLSQVALHGMAHSFIKLCKLPCHDKAVIHEEDHLKKKKEEKQEGKVVV